MEDDWGLQAVVRGYCITTTSSATSSTANTASTTTTMADPFSFFAPSLDRQLQHENPVSFPDLFEPTTGIEELEQLYKPFFPKLEPAISHHQSVPTSINNPPVLQHNQKQQKQQQLQSHRSTNLAVAGSLSAAVSNTATSTPHTPRPKRRKNQQKKVVCQVPAEGLSSDMWAWRKYGQKPIKGSPYPRGYYRCSSSKGCLARKQVERSRSDPGMFVITYTAEHNHPVPTHRNSLAGSTRNKISTPQRTTTTTTGDSSDPTTTTTTTTTSASNKPSCSPSSPASTTGHLSPTTPLTASMDEELAQPSKQDQSREDGEEVLLMDEEDESELLIPEGLLSDDLFNGLEELAGPNSATSTALDDCFSDHFPASFPSPWFATNAAAAAGGS